MAKKAESRGRTSGVGNNNAMDNGATPVRKDEVASLLGAQVSVFLSYPNPCGEKQREFLKKVQKFLQGRGFFPRTLGVTDYDADAPLKSIRRLMIECNGIITIAFRRTFVREGFKFQASEPPDGPCDKDLEAKKVGGQWYTSPWAQIEPAMAYQLGLPILILREKGVAAEGILERGVLGIYMPEFDLDTPGDYLETLEWNGMIRKWEGYVRSVVEKRGNPPQLYP